MTDGGSHEIRPVLELLGVSSGRVRRIGQGHEGDHNGNWKVWPPGGVPCVLRRYHRRATLEDLQYEHAVLWHLAAAGWTVPAPLGDLVQWHERWYCLTEHVPGRSRQQESLRDQRQRGELLAQLHVAMRTLGDALGQRPGWRMQHESTTVHTDIDWVAGLSALAQHQRQLAERVSAAADAVAMELDAIGAAELPVTVVHGDFAEWNLHFVGRRSSGVLDFGLTHQDSRPYELAIARTYRAPEVRSGYRVELSHLGWPLSEHEEQAIEPIYRAFRVDMVAWQLDEGRRNGRFDLTMIESQLSRAAVTGTP